MKKYFLAAMAIVPVALLPSNAAQQSWSDPSTQVYMGWPSDEAGTNSYLGVDVNDVTADRLSALKLKEEKGVEVTMVDQDAPAGKAGIKEHDVIMSVNGTPVDSAAQLRRVIHETPPGRVITLVLSRDGEPLTVKTQLADRAKLAGNSWPKMNINPEVHVLPQISVAPAVPAIPAMEFSSMPATITVLHSPSRSGLTVENLTPQLGEFFGIKDGKGVLVRGVEKGSRAEQAGLKAGDIIVRINDQPVHDTTDFSYVLRRSHDAKSVSVGIMRDKHEQTLTLQQPEPKESGELFNNFWMGPDFEAYNGDDSLITVDDMLADLRPEIMSIADENFTEDARRAAEQAVREACEQQKQWMSESKKWDDKSKEWVVQSQKMADQAKELSNKNMKEAQQQLRQLQRKMRDARHRAGSFDI